MAVQGHGQNAGDGGFAYAPVSAEDVAMRNPLLLDGIFQGAGNMVLPDNPRKALRTIFAREYLITHGKSDYTLAGAFRFSTLNEKALPLKNAEDAAKNSPLTVGLAADI